VALTTASCPQCGAAAEPEAATCSSCGFIFFELPASRSLPRPSAAWIAVGVAVLVACGAAVVLLTREPEPGPPQPVPAARAERLLERRLDAGPGASVRCPPARIDTLNEARCQFVYPDGDTQLMLVTLGSDGELEIEVPYPAQRRPGD
jgi:hypothetical protein